MRSADVRFVWAGRRAHEKTHQGTNMRTRPIGKEPRDCQLNLSLTVSEWENLRRRAEALGLRPAHYGRSLLLAAKDCERPRPSANLYDDHAPLMRLTYGQLIRVGSNLNQMMRHLHWTGDPLPSDLEPLLKDIRALLDRVSR